MSLYSMKNKSNFSRQAVFSLLLGSTIVIAQEGKEERRGPKDRGYTQTESKPVKYYPASETAPFKGEITITVTDSERIIKANGMPNHKMGKYPNEGNPNIPTVQDFEIVLPLKPKVNERAIRANRSVGVMVNGILIESGSGEFWFSNDGSSLWNYNALGGALDFGVDTNHAHVQPTGKYHYHGVPTGLLKEHSVEKGKHSPIVGWAFDGFPIYALHGYKNGKDGEVIQNTSSYRLKKGVRPSQPDGPGGKYDGAFNDDFIYEKGLGTLDECNGRFTVTPEFPEGTYAYFITEEWPVFLTKYRGDKPVRPVGEKGPPKGKDMKK